MLSHVQHSPDAPTAMKKVVGSAFQLFIVISEFFFFEPEKTRGSNK
jgi:hypothetical protein